LSVAIKPVIGLRRKPAIEVIAVTNKPPVFVVVREIPLPIASFVKKPVPWTLISFLISWDNAQAENSSTDARSANNKRFMLVPFLP